MKTDKDRSDPDNAKISDIQAARLADMTGEPLDKIKGQKFNKLYKELEWKISPDLLLFRRVCGQVVKRNPVSGELEGVPNATVHVEDTDCTFHIYTPPSWPKWSWFFPTKCKRELIATTTTDECGHFCVWIPAWEIDWIIKWRHARLCFPTLYPVRVKDWLERIPLPELEREPPRIKWPRPPEPRFSGRPSVEATPIEIPKPKPDPYARMASSGRLTDLVRRPEVLDHLREGVGEVVAAQLETLVSRSSFGGNTKKLEAELEMRAVSVPPPLPENAQALDADMTDEMRADMPDVDFNRWVGPFWRCVDVVFGIWTKVKDVPDITFRVTQDVDDDGIEEEIYSEGFFDVRWNSTGLSDIVLEAEDHAVSSPHCEGPEIDPSGCSAPTILTAGLMPLEAPYFDLATGYSRMVNRARSGGLSTSARDRTTTAPLWSTVQLHGCHRFPGAVHYRLMKKHQSSTSFTPILDESWWAPRLGAGGPFHIVPDANGWYPILPAGDLVFPHWLLNWRTQRYANGRYEMQLELGDAGKSVIDTSAAVPIQIDNTRPHAVFTAMHWRPAGPGDWLPLPAVCPVIRRPAGTDIEIRVSCDVSAAHLRNSVLFGRSCEGTALTKLDAVADYDHWHVTEADNSWTTTARFLVGGASDEGAYTIGINAQGRAFNPAGGDAGPSSGWDYDEEYSWTHPRRHIAIVNI
ncbi:hypothetical protein ACXYMO_08810 [Arenibacterium sp. CAU 1754]